jgi:Gluconate 2-dehydrogenase subunit 3
MEDVQQGWKPLSHSTGNHKESCIVAINLEPAKLGKAEQYVESLPHSRLQRLVDEGAVYAPQALNQSQFATLHALLERILLHDVNAAQLAARLDTALAHSTADGLSFTAPHPLAFDYQLGLDELDTMARTTTGFAFAELTPEIQDAMLGLVSGKNLTTRKLDLSLWLDDLRHNTTASLALSAK